MLEFVVGFTVGWFVMIGMDVFIGAVTRKIGNGIRIGGEEDRPDYAPPADLEQRGDL